MKKEYLMNEPNHIELSLPVNSAYITTVRHIVTSIADNAGFGADEIDDMEVAVCAACIYVIRNVFNIKMRNTKYNIRFIISKCRMDICLDCPKLTCAPNEENDIGLRLIQGLTEGMTVESEENRFSMKFCKTRRNDLFRENTL